MFSNSNVTIWALLETFTKLKKKHQIKKKTLKIRANQMFFHLQLNLKQTKTKYL